MQEWLYFERMSNHTLKDRIDAYAEASSLKLLGRLPVITVINGRSFTKLTTLLDKPFSNDLAQCFCSALLGLVQEIDGALLGYSYGDELVVISRNDQFLETQPWYNNDVQKIASVSASIATLHFNNYAATLDLNFMGDPIFYSQVFVVPNITEAINVLISKQQRAFQSSVQFACFFELLKKYDRNTIKDMLFSASINDKIDLLQQECHINFDDYPAAFRRGVACYKAPKITIYEGKEVIKNKWTLNDNIPIFTQEHSFLNSIFKMGHDVLRGETI